MTRKPTIHLEPVPEPLSREMTAYVTETVYSKLKDLVEGRGEKGVSTVLRKLAVAALDKIFSL